MLLLLSVLMNAAQLCVSKTMTTPAPGSDTHQYCWQNGFNATCNENEVILMEHAHYGRMRDSHCLTSTAHLGCYADVLPQLDVRCSGHRSCKVSIPDTDLHELQPCPKDMLVYIEARYKCVKVHRPHGKCSSTAQLQLTESEGYVSTSLPSVGPDAGPSPGRCTWRVQAQPGQKINITLLDFTVGVPGEPSHTMCLVYAVVREPSTGAEVTVCRGGGPRYRQVYVSEKNSLDLLVLADVVSEQGVRFLLKYKIVGCPDPVLPKGAWYKRNLDKVAVHCNRSSETWFLYCSGNRWIGPTRNCSQVLARTDVQEEKTGSYFPYSLFSAVVIGIILGILLGIAMLALILVAQRRRRRRRKSLESTTDTKRTDSQSDTLHFHYPSGTLKEHNLGQYGYSHVWELHSVKSVPIDDIIGTNDVTKSVTSASSPLTKDNTVYCEHTYTPHRNCEVISSIGGGRREHTYEAPHHNEKNLAGIHKIKSRNLNELSSAFSDLDNKSKDNTQNLHTLDRQKSIPT